jgi:hypothetical protein
MDRLDSANVARVVARMDAIAAAQAHPIAVTDSVHWRFPLFWVTSPTGAGLDLPVRHSNWRAGSPSRHSTFVGW